MHQPARTSTRSPRARVAALLSAVIAVTMVMTPLAPSTGAQGDPLRVVASFSVLADLVGNVGGDDVEVTSLVPIGGDAHTFDPSPDQVADLTDADLIVQVGGEFEPWLADMVESSGTDAPVLSLFAEDGHGDEHADDDHADEVGTPPADDDHADDDHADDDHADEVGTPPADDDHADDDHAGDDHADDDHADDDHAGDDHADDDHADEDGHDHGDLHGWLNVHTTVHAVEDIAAALSEVAPDRADTFTANADTYIAELDRLEAYIEEQTGTIPEDRRLLVTTHQSMGAFADAYGYEIAGVLLESHSTEGADAPASHVAELTGIIRERGIPAVFADAPGGEGLMQPLAAEAGVLVAPALYVETLGEDGSGAETYIDMMRHNIDTIVAALAALAA